MFATLDAMAAYGMVRTYKPSHILEIGARVVRHARAITFQRAGNYRRRATTRRFVA